MCCRTAARFLLTLSLLAMTVTILGLTQAFAQSGVDDPLGTFQMEGDAQRTNTICFLQPASGGPAIATPGVGAVNSLDGNGCPTVNPSNAPATWNFVQYAGSTDDWSSFAFSSTGGPHFTNKGHSLFIPSFISDPVNSQTDNTFLGTASKDTQDITQWTWNPHGVQDKDDIEHAFAGAYQGATGNEAGHTIIVAGMDRLANAGDSTAGFWFVQDSSFALCVGVGLEANPSGGSPISNPACKGSGTFVGTHFDGDLLIVSDFSTGGAVSTINIFKWVGNGPAGSLQFDTGRSPAPCDPFADGNTICGLVNDQFQQVLATSGKFKGQPVLVATLTQTGGWSFGDKTGNAAYLAGEFLEISVDLNVVFGGNPPCFSKFFSETRSSTSATASLSDLTIPVSFPLCSLSASKQCSTASVVTLQNGTQVIRYPFTGSVNNTGSATIYSANLTDTPPTAAQGYISGSLTINGNTATPGTPVLLSNTTSGIASGQSASYSGTLDTSAVLGTGALNSISVTASSDSSGSPQNVGPGTGDWGDPTSCAPTINTGLTAAKKCETCLLGGTDLHVQVTEGVKVCNTGNTTVTNLQVFDCRGTFSGTPGGSPSPSCSTGFITLTGFPSSLGAAGSGTDCATVNVSYNPASCPDSSNSNCTFTDTVYASGNATFSGTVFAPPTNTSCTVCPINTSCPTITFP